MSRTRWLFLCLVAVGISLPATARAQTVVTSTAGATYGTIAGTDSVSSNTVQTIIVFPDLYLEKILDGPASALVGEQVSYTIRYGNNSADVDANQVVLTDTLPAELTYVSSQPAGSANGQIITWNVGDLAPGDTSQISLVVQVANTVRDTVLVTNVVTATSANASARSAAAAAVELTGVLSNQLTLDKTADVLEIRVGETAPYALVVENTGATPLSDIRIHDLLPEGSRYSTGSAIGADSVQAIDRNITFFVAGPLAPGATHTVRYQVAIVSAGAELLENRAFATAESEFVQSQESVAWVRVRRNYPLETRAAIGKVWVDENANGVQDPGEPGLPGVDIWTADGVVAITDDDGKFSYRNVRPGGHAFRLDPVTVPADYRIPDSEDIVALTADGWTTPNIEFRVLPVAGSLRQAEINRAVNWQLSTRRHTPPPPPPPPAPIAAPDTTIAALDSLMERATDSIRPTDIEQKPLTLILKGVEFELGVATLTDSARAILDMVAVSLLDHAAVRVELSGHTDTTGPREYNLQLSFDRAASAREYLTNWGVDSSRIAVQGFGPDRPLESNDTFEGRQRNRRVELRVLQELPGEIPEPENGVASAGADPAESTEPDSSDTHDPQTNGEPPSGESTNGDSTNGHEQDDNAALFEALIENGHETLIPVDTVPPPEPTLEYEVTFHNDYAVALEGMVLELDHAIDSVLIQIGDSIFPFEARRRIALPTLPPNTRGVVRAWSASPDDSASVVLWKDGERSSLRVGVRDSAVSTEGVIAVRKTVDDLPHADDIATQDAITLTLEPSAGGWPHFVYQLPGTWEFVEGSTRRGDTPAPDPKIRRDRNGSPRLEWDFGQATRGPVTIGIRKAGAGSTSATVRVTPLRTDEERKAEAGRAFIAGPGVEVFSVDDGTVLASDRIFVGARGEAGKPVELFNGDSLISSATFRIDGVHDFIGVALERGPQRLRIKTQNSWGHERWDSLTVHVSGQPAALELGSNKLQMSADGQSVKTLRVRILDEWGVPVVTRPNVTVLAEGAEPLGVDSDPSSVGFQLRADQAGWLTVPIRPGRDVGTGKVQLASGDATGEVDIDLLPPLRSLLVTGVGQFGVGASPDAYGAVTARGRLDERTAITVSMDSRRLDAGRQDFDRSFDPLEEAQYPIFGDASEARTLGSSRYALFAKVERGFDWVAFGDISTGDFGNGLELNTYRRSLSAGMARVTTGPVVWQGFGTVTSQSLQQSRIRGAGISGPYQVAANVSRGTERIVIETRDRSNPQRIVTRQQLVRFVDYEIDYETGTLLFKRPVPATDQNENPVFLEVTYETESGGDSRTVGGVRASVDATNLVRTSFLDSVQVGVTSIHANESLGRFTLTGADIQLVQAGGVKIGGEVSRSAVPDSTGIAATVDASVDLLDGALNLGAAFTRIGFGFSNPSNTALRSGTKEFRASGRYRFRQSEFRFTHDHMRFAAEGVQRQNTGMTYRQIINDQFTFEAAQVLDRYEQGTATDRSLAGETKLTYTPGGPLSLWTEARKQFTSTGDLVRPDHIGAGAALQVAEDLAIEGRFRYVLLPDDDSYSVTNFGLRSDIGFGTQAYGSYQIAGGVGGQYNAALVGLNNRIQLGPSLTINSMFERRAGVGGADPTDPVRALPFLQAEEDYWSLAAGVELLPQDKPYTLSTRGEYRDGEAFSTRLLSMAGAVSFNRSLAVLSRNRFMKTEQISGASSQFSTLWGLAFRPFNTNRVNVLTTLSWLKDTNPFNGGVLIQRGDERRTIGAAEVIWAPTGRSEVTGRFAARRTFADRQYDDGTIQALESSAHFAAGRVAYDITPQLTFRNEGRVLLERTSGSQRWDMAPSLGFEVLRGLEVAGGYRFGDLQDPDFSVRGGHGAFVTFNVRVTEDVLSSAASFWRARFQ